MVVVVVVGGVVVGGGGAVVVNGGGDAVVGGGGGVVVVCGGAADIMACLKVDLAITDVYDLQFIFLKLNVFRFIQCTTLYKINHKFTQDISSCL